MKQLPADLVILAIFHGGDAERRRLILADLDRQLHTALLNNELDAAKMAYGTKLQCELEEAEEQYEAGMQDAAEAAAGILAPDALRAGDEVMVYFNKHWYPGILAEKTPAGKWNVAGEGAGTYVNISTSDLRRRWS